MDERTLMVKPDEMYTRLDAAARQLNQLARPGGRRRPSAISIAALVGAALAMAVSTARRRRSSRR